MSQVKIQGNASGTGIFTVASPNSNTDRTITLPDATGTVLTSGTTVTVAQGGTGATSLTANNVILGNGTSAVQVVAPGSSGNVLTSNGTTWTSAAPAAPTTNQVLTATAGASVDAVGTYAYLRHTTGTATLNPGDTAAGSEFVFASGAAGSGTTVATGTWRIMGQLTSTSAGSSNALTLCLRIS